MPAGIQLPPPPPSALGAGLSPLYQQLSSTFPYIAVYLAEGGTYLFRNYNQASSILRKYRGYFKSDEKTFKALILQG
jgi:hypothetical protein